MALVKITNPPTEFLNSSEWTDFVNRSGKTLIGVGTSLQTFTLTNWDSGTLKPEVAAGSLIEVGGSLYQADIDTELTDETGLVDGTCHIKLVPNGDGSEVAPTLTNDNIPAWDQIKSGWYDGVDKFLPYEFIQSGIGTAWGMKTEYIRPEKKAKLHSNGAISNIVTTFSGTPSLQILLEDWYIGKGFYSVAFVDINGMVFQAGPPTYFDSDELLGTNMERLFLSTSSTTGSSTDSVILQNYNVPPGSLNSLRDGSPGVFNIGFVYFHGGAV